MRSPHVVSMVFNGVEGDSRVLKSARAAQNMGFQATILGVGGGPVAQRTEFGGVPVILLPNFAERLGKLGLWTKDTVSRDLNLMMTGYAFESLIPQVIELAPDVIHSHDMNTLKAAAMCRQALASTGSAVYWVHDLHEYVAGLRGEIAEHYMPICLDWERNYLHRADHLITVSPALAQIIRDRYHLPKSPTVLLNAPYLVEKATDAPDVRSAIGLRDSVPLVAFIGAASDLRGCDTIVKAVASMPGVHIVFVSKSAYVGKLSDLAREFGAGARFHTHSPVNGDQLTTFIRTADLGIHGMVHYPNGEVALPNKLFEYLHAGLPVVVSDVAAMKDFVDRHQVGEVFVAGDITSCADVIAKVLRHKVRYAEKITCAIIQENSWQKQEGALQQIYGDGVQSLQPVSSAARDSALAEAQTVLTAHDARMARALAETALRLAHRTAEEQRMALTALPNRIAGSVVKRFTALPASKAKKRGLKHVAKRILATLRSR